MTGVQTCALPIYTDSGNFEGYGAGIWMPFANPNASNTFDQTTFTGDGSTTDFELPGYPTTNSTFVNIEGTFQLPGTSYSITDSVISFTEAIPNGSKVDIRSFALVGEYATAVTLKMYENLDTNLTIIDRWLVSSFRSAEYIIQVDNGTLGS